MRKMHAKLIVGGRCCRTDHLLCSTFINNSSNFAIAFTLDESAGILSGESYSNMHLSAGESRGAVTSSVFFKDLRKSVIFFAAFGGVTM